MGEDIKVLEAQIRQIFAGVVWSHKIQEKQADIYQTRYNILEVTRILMSALTTSGILVILLVKEQWLAVATAFVSVVTLFLNSYFKTYNLQELHKKHKHSALNLLEIREELICLLTDIKIGHIDGENIIIKRDEILGELMEVYKDSIDASLKAVTRASENLKGRQDNTYTDEEVDSFLPVLLKNIVKG